MPGHLRDGSHSPDRAPAAAREAGRARVRSPSEVPPRVVAHPKVTGFLRLKQILVPAWRRPRAADLRCCSPDWTRTNNPAINSPLVWGSRSSAVVRTRRSDAHAVIRVRLRTTVNAPRWHTDWHTALPPSEGRHPVDRSKPSPAWVTTISSWPSWPCGFDSRHPLHGPTSSYARLPSSVGRRRCLRAQWCRPLSTADHRP